MSSMIFLYGAPASGKSTLGKTLAERLGGRFVDLDAAIVAAEGREIPSIFATDGEAAFRDIESRVLAQVIAAHAESRACVIALGGGTLLRDANRALCEKAGTILLLEPPDAAELARRIAANPNARPLGDRAQERAAHYASFPNRIVATLDVHGSLVLVGQGIAASVLASQPLVTDATVASLYREALSQSLATIPSGEVHKTPATVQGLWRVFAAAGLGRRDCVVSCGGGVTSDLVGFAAATWMRGMDWINVPTTLLAMVDASVGGKTGCDLPEGKNLAGAFHPPRLVAIDVDFLKTLPARELAAGRAEMIKHELIGGRIAAPDLVHEIAANLRVKADIVNADPEERLGKRILLNCGHTVAHAVERLTDFRLSHGEAVAIGCVEEARLAVRLGLAAPGWPDELATVFAAANLPTALPDGLAFDSMRETMKGDKKRAGDTVTFVVPCGWGDVRPVAVDLGVRS